MMYTQRACAPSCCSSRVAGNLQVHAMSSAPRARVFEAHRVMVPALRMTAVPVVRRGGTASTTAAIHTPSPHSARQLAGVGASTSAQALGLGCDLAVSSMRKRAPQRSSVGRSPAGIPSLRVRAGSSGSATTQNPSGQMR